MTHIRIDSLDAIAQGDDREELTVSWTEIGKDGNPVEKTGEFFLLKKIGYGASLRLASARNVTEQTAALLVERVRLGKDGSEKFTPEAARLYVESDSPVVAAICNKVWERLTELQKDGDEAGEESAVKH